MSTELIEQAAAALRHGSKARPALAPLLDPEVELTCGSRGSGIVTAVRPYSPCCASERAPESAQLRWN